MVVLLLHIIYTSLCLMSADLCISVFRRCPFLQVHALQNRIFSIFFLDVEHGFLHVAFPFQIRFLFLPLFFYSLIICKKIKLLIRIIIRDSMLIHQFIRGNINPPDQKILVDDPVIQFHYRIHKYLRR